ncbi:hypothetical protein VTO42DRAFT_2754 [Malbranchea cinnamomea]
MESRTTYQFASEEYAWKLAPSLNFGSNEDETKTGTLTVSSYNIMVETVDDGQSRYPVLLQNILSPYARADVLVLQEVCDDFLSYLLSNETVRQIYPFTTHRPPNQAGVGPLPSIRNIVVLANVNFRWSWVPFEARHKGSVILEFNGMGRFDEDGNFLPVILAGVHLTAGLNDEGVMAQKSQLLRLLDTLRRNFPENPEIIAGDFNIAASVFSIEYAFQERRITHETYNTQLGLELLLSKAHLSDAWYVARTEIGSHSLEWTVEDINRTYEGEQGAIFNPIYNPLAEKSAKTGGGRPQRYDRIFVKGGGLLAVSDFNLFGFPSNYWKLLDTHQGARCEHKSSSFGSDHWGVRATFRFISDDEEKWQGFNTEVPPFQKASGNLARSEDLKSCIIQCGMVPSADEIQRRSQIFRLVENVL